MRFSPEVIYVKVEDTPLILETKQDQVAIKKRADQDAMAEVVMASEETQIEMVGDDMQVDKAEDEIETERVVDKVQVERADDVTHIESVDVSSTNELVVNIEASHLTASTFEQNEDTIYQPKISAEDAAVLEEILKDPLEPFDETFQDLQSSEVEFLSSENLCNSGEDNPGGTDNQCSDPEDLNVKAEKIVIKVLDGAHQICYQIQQNLAGDCTGKIIAF